MTQQYQHDTKEFATDIALWNTPSDDYFGLSMDSYPGPEEYLCEETDDITDIRFESTLGRLATKALSELKPKHRLLFILLADGVQEAFTLDQFRQLVALCIPLSNQRKTILKRANLYYENGCSHWRPKQLELADVLEINPKSVYNASKQFSLWREKLAQKTLSALDETQRQQLSELYFRAHTTQK